MKKRMISLAAAVLMLTGCGSQTADTSDPAAEVSGSEASKSESSDLCDAPVSQ